MGHGKVVLVVLPLLRKWLDVVDVELILVYDRVDQVFADEADATLAVQEALFQCCSVFLAQCCQNL